MGWLRTVLVAITWLVALTAVVVLTWPWWMDAFDWATDISDGTPIGELVLAGLASVLFLVGVLAVASVPAYLVDAFMRRLTKSD